MVIFHSYVNLPEIYVWHIYGCRKSLTIPESHPHAHQTEADRWSVETHGGKKSLRWWWVKSLSQGLTELVTFISRLIEPSVFLGQKICLGIWVRIKGLEDLNLGRFDVQSFWSLEVDRLVSNLEIWELIICPKTRAHVACSAMVSIFWGMLQVSFWTQLRDVSADQHWPLDTHIFRLCFPNETIQVFEVHSFLTPCPCW